MSPTNEALVSIKKEMNQKLNMESSQPEGGPRIFIGGLNLDTVDSALEGYFSKFGSLTEARVTRHEFDKTSKGFGFVTFSDDAELDSCQRARPHFIDGANVSTFRYVAKDQDKKNMNFMDAPRGHCKKLYVSELDQSVKEDDLNCYFGQYGNIIDIELKLGNTQSNAKWKGNFAFIEFDDYDPIDKCVEDGEHKVDGKVVVVRRALAKHGKDVERKIFVGPLTDQLTDEMLYNYYNPYGKVTRIERPLDKKSRKRRDFAFIEFVSMEPVEKIVESENHTIEGHEVRVKKVGPKDWTRSTNERNARSNFMGSQGAMWNQGNFSPMGMFDQRAMAMAGMNQGMGAFYQGFPPQMSNQGYGMPQGRSMGPMKSNRGQVRFSPYDPVKEIEMPEECLLRYFSNFGNVIKVDRPWDGKNNRKRDYAFVEFEDPNSVRMCMLYPGHQIMGQNLIVRKGSSKGEPHMERKVFVDLKGKSRSS